MRGIARLPLIIALAQLLHLSLASPALQTSTSPLLVRSQYCFNAPGTKAGSFLSRRAGGGIPPAPGPTREAAHVIFHGNSANELIIWCRALSRTYVSATWQSPLTDISWSTAQSVLAIAIAMVHQQIVAAGDGPLAKGTFEYGIQNAQVQAANSNNHQMTWGVLGAALAALVDYFTYLQTNFDVPPGRVHFSIRDGENEVGQGLFDNEPSSSAAPPSGS